MASRELHGQSFSFLITTGRALALCAADSGARGRGASGDPRLVRDDASGCQGRTIACSASSRAVRGVAWTIGVLRGRKDAFSKGRRIAERDGESYRGVRRYL